MSIPFALAVYFMIWWIVLFAILPFGVRTQEEDGAVTPGSVPSAPSRPLLLRKALWTTVVASAVFASFVWLRASGITLDDIPLPGPR
ncbi:DUF1467 family protein [Polymorphum gilvum]|nr:DUF1467 family protein [Polymorphum gilvum]